MKGAPPPLRFLAILVGGWIAIRVIAFTPAWTAEPSRQGPDSARRPPPVEVAALPFNVPPVHQAAPVPRVSPTVVPARFLLPMASGRMPFGLVRRDVGLDRWPPSLSVPRDRAYFAAPSPATALLSPPPPLAQLFQPASASPSRQRRMAASTWLLLRDGDSPGLAPGGELGGSQAGMRVTYRIAGREAPLALSGRLYLPLARPEGAEAALGIDWRPLPRVPLNLLAERRQAIGRDGRSDFALTVHGGGERRIGPLRVEAWGQAGAVGLEDPDLFADGLVRATMRAGPVDVGGGAWGGAQPGASRIDVGPHVSTRVPVAGATLRLIAEWRFRVAGEAAPGSGPAVTVASDF